MFQMSIHPVVLDCNAVGIVVMKTDAFNVKKLLQKELNNLVRDNK